MKKFLIGGAVVALAALVVMVPDLAFAQQLKNSITNAGDQIKDVPKYINYGSYIIGTAAGVGGVASLKKHVDNPGQEPINKGLARLAAAGLFIGLPSLLAMMQASTKNDQATNSFTTLNSMN